MEIRGDVVECFWRFVESCGDFVERAECKGEEQVNTTTTNQRLTSQYTRFWAQDMFTRSHKRI